MAGAAAAFMLVLWVQSYLFPVDTQRSIIGEYVGTQVAVASKRGRLSIYMHRFLVGWPTGSIESSVVGVPSIAAMDRSTMRDAQGRLEQENLGFHVSHLAAATLAVILPLVWTVPPAEGRGAADGEARVSDAISAKAQLAAVIRRQIESMGYDVAVRRQGGSVKTTARERATGETHSIALLKPDAMRLVIQVLRRNERWV